MHKVDQYGFYSGLLNPPSPPGSRLPPSRISGVQLYRRCVTIEVPNFPDGSCFVVPDGRNIG